MDDDPLYTIEITLDGAPEHRDVLAFEKWVLARWRELNPQVTHEHCPENDRPLT